jgi:hypothetical protein
MRHALALHTALNILQLPPVAVGHSFPEHTHRSSLSHPTILLTAFLGRNVPNHLLSLPSPRYPIPLHASLIVRLTLAWQEIARLER